MNFENLVINRRSIREYDERDVSSKEIEKIINAGRWAPTAGNVQEVKFIVVKKKDIKEKLAKAAYDQNWIIKAPYVLVVCANREILRARYDEVAAERYALCDGSAAIQNMLLMATELGLGSCWVGAFDSEKIRTLMRIPSDTKIVGIVTIGHYSKRARLPIRKGLREFIFTNEWGNKDFY